MDYSGRTSITVSDFSKNAIRYTTFLKVISSRDDSAFCLHITVKRRQSQVTPTTALSKKECGMSTATERFEISTIMRNSIWRFNRLSVRHIEGHEIAVTREDVVEAVHLLCSASRSESEAYWRFNWYAASSGLDLHNVKPPSGLPYEPKFLAKNHDLSIEKALSVCCHEYGEEIHTNSECPNTGTRSATVTQNCVFCDDEKLVYNYRSYAGD